MHGVHEEGNVRQQLGDLPGGSQAIHHRHHQIEDDEVGLEFLGPGNSILPIFDRNDFPRSGALEKGPQGSPNRGTILSNQYPGGHANGQQVETGGAARSCFQ